MMPTRDGSSRGIPAESLVDDGGDVSSMSTAPQPAPDHRPEPLVAASLRTRGGLAATTA